MSLNKKNSEKYEKIRELVLKKNKLSLEEFSEVINNVDSTIKRIEFAIKKKKINAIVMLGGSSAKGSIIKGNFDADIFVRFNKKYAKDNDILSDILETALYDFKDIRRVHGSRDYFQFELNNISYEIIPVLNFTSLNDIMNVTDMSPMHVTWIKEKIKSKPNIIDEIILAKLFCKNAGIYGAESFICGFSGHVIDILINYYGSFISLLESSFDWKDNDVIDIEKHGNIKKLNQSKLSSLIIIDPVYSERNAAAALNIKNIRTFQMKAKEFLKDPSEKYFIPKYISIESLKLSYKDIKDEKLIILKATPLEGKTDIIGCKILKVLNCLKRELKENGFDAIECDWFWDKKSDALLWVSIKKEKMSDDIIRIGPFIDDLENVSKFKEKYKKTIVKDKKIYAKIKRIYTKPQDLVIDIINSKYVLEKIKNIKIVR